VALTGDTPTTRVIEFGSDVQAAAYAYGPGPQCASGGWGAGKTFVYCLKALALSDLYPRNRGVIARRIAKELRATTMATFFKLCPPSAYSHGSRNDQEGKLVLNNGSEILFLHLDDPDTEGVIKGLEINWFFVDQAEENPEQMEEIFDLLLGRLMRWDLCQVPDALVKAHEDATGTRWPFWFRETNKPAPPPYAMLACNPDIELHWIYRRFHPESADHPKYAALGYKMFDMPSTANRFLSETNLSYLLAHDEAFVRRNVRGIWGMPEGAIHSLDARSLIDGDPQLVDYLRSTCTLHRTLDHGDTAPTCCLWFAVDRAGNAFCVREYYLPNALVSTHRANITALSEGERYSSNYADPSIFAKLHQKHGGRWSTADEYRDVLEHPASTVLHWNPADNNELGTRNRINEYLRIDPERLHPLTRQRGAPRLYFVQESPTHPQGCRHVLRELRSQRRVKIGMELGRPIFSDERDETIPDHAYDPVRYFIASRPALPSKLSPGAVPGTFEGEARRMEQALRKRRA